MIRTRTGACIRTGAGRRIRAWRRDGCLRGFFWRIIVHLHVVCVHIAKSHSLTCVHVTNINVNRMPKGSLNRR